MAEMKHVTVTKTVPVNNRETLEVWLNEQLAEWLTGQRDGGGNKLVAGRRAIDLILEAGFTLEPPVLNRAPRS